MRNSARVPLVPAVTWYAVGKKAERLTLQCFPQVLVDAEPFPVAEFIEFHMKDILGFEFEVQELPVSLEAMINPVDRVMTLSEETYMGLVKGVPRSRFTVAHEIGHVLLHARYLGDLILENKGILTLNRGNIPSYKDPECQANAFAAALLMPTRHVKRMIDEGYREESIAELFHVSWDAAHNRLGNLSRYIK